MIRKILLAYDGSEPAEKAWALALDLARCNQAALLVLAVARPPELAEDVETEALLESAEEHFKERFAALRAQAEQQSVNPDFRIVVGHPAEQIIYLAEKEGVDHIVMGHRGKSFFQRWRLGSVSRQVINYANCAVTVMR